MINIEDNTKIRNEMKQFVDNNFDPSLKKIAKAMSMNYTMFADWYRNDRNFGDKTLKKVEKFLRSVQK